MRALLLAAVLAGCGGGGASSADGFVAPECFPQQVSVCQIWVDVPQVGVPFLWTCTTGIGHPEINKPDHRPCAVCWPPQQHWCETGIGACVDDCASCTPAALLKVNQWARCKPADENWLASWQQRDMGGPI
jgi:hypothetical protein